MSHVVHSNYTEIKVRLCYTDTIGFSGSNAMLNAPTVYGALKGRNNCSYPPVTLACSLTQRLMYYYIVGIETFSQLVNQDDTGAVSVHIEFLTIV